MIKRTFKIIFRLVSPFLIFFIFYLIWYIHPSLICVVFEFRSFAPQILFLLISLLASLNILKDLDADNKMINRYSVSLIVAIILWICYLTFSPLNSYLLNDGHLIKAKESHMQVHRLIGNISCGSYYIDLRQKDSCTTVCADDIREINGKIFVKNNFK